MLLEPAVFGRSRFAQEIGVAGQREDAARRAGRARHQLQTELEVGSLFRRQRERATIGRRLTGDQHRRAQIVRKERAVGIRELERCDQEVALADGQVDLVARVPWLARFRFLPGRIGNEPVLLRNADGARRSAGAG